MLSSAFRWWVIALLATLTLIIEAPLIAFPMYAGDSYRGINVAPFGNDEHHYLTRGKEVLEGNGVGQPYLAEWKDAPDSFQSHSEYVLMTPFRLLGMENANVVTLFNILNTIGVFIMLLLIYLFVYQLSQNVLLSLAAAIFSIGGYVLVQNGTVLMWFLRGQDLIFGSPNIFGRSTDPYTALVPFFGFLILTYRAAMAEFRAFSWEEYKPYAYVLGAGVLFGVLFYDYFYAWTFALALLGSLFLTSLMWRRFSAALASAAIGIIGLIVAIPMLIGFISLFVSELGAQFAFYFMATHSRAFIGSMTGMATSILFLIYWYYKRDDRNNFFLLALILAGWVALEQQMITGRVIQYGHYYWYFVAPLSILVGTYMIVRLLPDSRREWERWLSVAIIVVALFYSAAQQYRAFFPELSWKMREQEYAPIIDALRELPRGVVLTDPGGQSYPFMVTIFTDHDLYWLPAAITSAFDIEYLKEVLLVYLFINKESRADPLAYLESALASDTANEYTEMYEELEAFKSGIPMQDYWRQPFPRTDPLILSARGSFLPYIGEEYEKRADTVEKILDTLEERNVRYVVWDVRENPEWDLSILGSLEVIATSSDITLYRMVSSSNHSLPTTE